MVTTTLLAAVSAAPAWADCEALRQQLVGQYGVMLKYEQGAEATAQRCRQLNAPLVPDQAALAQCNANYQMFSNAVVQADTTYLQLYNNYSAVCTTTATYGPKAHLLTPRTRFLRHPICLRLMPTNHPQPYRPRL